MDSSPDAPLQVGRLKTPRIFATLGVTVEWRGSYQCPSGELRVSLTEIAPPDFHAGALAYALPYEGTHNVLFLDRIRQSHLQKESGMVLAYVIAHESAHILQGVARHSDSGLMKAEWTSADFQKMRLGRLNFTADDVDLIYTGLRRRNAGPALSAEVKDYHGQTAVTEAAR